MTMTNRTSIMCNAEADDTFGFRIYDQGYAGDDIREASVYISLGILAGPAVVGAYVLAKTAAAIK